MPPPDTLAPVPPPEPEPGWYALRAPGAGPAGPTFVSAEPASDRIRIRYYRRAPDDAVVGHVWFGPGAQGPPGNAHGGSVAAVLDEAMGMAAWRPGEPVVAAKLAVTFRRMLPLAQWVTLEATATWRSRLGAKTHGRLLAPDGVPFAQATGLFVRMRHGHGGPTAEPAPGKAPPS